MNRSIGIIGAVNGARHAPISPVAVHASDGRVFIGVRMRRDGVIQIVYDRVGVRRSIWEVMGGGIGLDGLQEACLRAINAEDCLATLHAALASAGIRIECVEERFGG
jgi:hypothetical protein